MKKAWKALLAALLAAVMAFGLIACDPNEPETVDPAIAAVAGDYGIYVADMGFTVYLRITEDGKFKLSAEEEFTSDKAQGTVGKPDAAYLMMYTSVNGEPKNAGDVPSTHFTLESDGRLKFTERITYGSSSIAPTEEAPVYAVPLEDYEEPVVVPVELDTYAAKAVFGEAEIETDLYLTLGEDEFTLFALYIPADAAEIESGFTFLRTGAVTQVGETLTLAVAGNDHYGSVMGGENGITLSVEDAEFSVAEAEYAMAAADVSKPMMSFTGESQLSAGPGMTLDFDLTLDVYANGKYAFASSTMMGTTATGAEENGTFAIDFTKATDNVTLYPDGGESVAATVNLADNTFSGSFVIFEMGGAGERENVSMTLSAKNFIGNYEVEIPIMSMKYALNIADGADGVTFEIYNSSETKVCEGAVTATVTGGVLAYSTPADKSAPFVREADGSLRFTESFTIVMGSSGNAMTMPSPVVDEEAGTETWICATPVVFEVEDATYAVSADFGAGAQYAFLTLEGDIFHYFLEGFETGNFASAHGSVTDEGGVKTLTDAQGNVFGTVTATAANAVTAELNLEAGEKELVMEKFSGSDEPIDMAGTVEVTLSMSETPIEFALSLKLYQNGKYEYKTTFTMGAMGEKTGYTERGYYAIDLTDPENIAIHFFVVTEEGAFGEAKTGAFGMTSSPITVTAQFLITETDEEPTEITVSFGGFDEGGGVVEEPKPQD